MRIDVLQLAPDYDATIAARRAAVVEEVRACPGTDLVVLPELWPQGGFTYECWADDAEPVDGPTVSALSEVARELGAHVHAGSIIERAGDGRLFNTSVLLGPDGAVVATYRKIHLFGFAEGEPELLAAGTDVVVADTASARSGSPRATTCVSLRCSGLSSMPGPSLS